MEIENSKYFVESQQIIDEIADVDYKSIALDELEDFKKTDDLELLLKQVQEIEDDRTAEAKLSDIKLTPDIVIHPPSIDELFRNYLMKYDFTRTLNTFQTEWFEKAHKSCLPEECWNSTFDAYLENERLEETIDQLQSQNSELKKRFSKMNEEIRKLKNDRDYHSLKHRQVLQEKEKLQTDIRSIREHYADYEPMLRDLRHKYEMVLKEKTLNRMERDRAINQAEGLRNAMLSLQNLGVATTEDVKPTNNIRPAEQKYEDQSEEQKRCIKYQTKVQRVGIPFLPPDRKFNPILVKSNKMVPSACRSAGRKVSVNFKAHEASVTNLAIHMNRSWLCSTSDDKTWKLWHLPTMELLLENKLHNNWICCADFHLDNSILATSDGEGSIRIWDLSIQDPLQNDGTISKTRENDNKSVEVGLLKHHLGAVWSINWHWCGKYLASGGIDNTIRIWDVEMANKQISSRRIKSDACLVTLRGHSNSVNSIQFLPYGNMLVSSSADKTVGIWDARSGIRYHTFAGHTSCVNHAQFNQQGTVIISCDSSGIVRLWDLRKAGRKLDASNLNLLGAVGQLNMINLAKSKKSHCPISANQLAVHLNSEYAFVACEDGIIYSVELSNGQTASLCGHEDSVHSVVIDHNSGVMYSGSSDRKICVWS